MNNKFSYTYSPRYMNEVEDIKRKYISDSVHDERLERLRRLDKSCELPGQITAIIMGIFGTALFSYGMIMIFGSQKYVYGIILSMAGLLIMAAAVPVFRVITRKRRIILAPEILRLSDEIQKNPSV